MVEFEEFGAHLRGVGDAPLPRAEDGREAADGAGGRGGTVVGESREVERRVSGEVVGLGSVALVLGEGLLDERDIVGAGAIELALQGADAPVGAGGDLLETLEQFDERSAEIRAVGRAVEPEQRALGVALQRRVGLTGEREAELDRIDARDAFEQVEAFLAPAALVLERLRAGMELRVRACEPLGDGR